MASPCARRVLVAALAGLSFAGSGCAVEWTRGHELYCRMDETLAIRETLSFDRDTIDDAVWKRFETETIASAFPNGYTLIDARSSRIVTIVHADDAASDAAAREIVKRFRDAFPPANVLRERTAVCASRWNPVHAGRFRRRGKRHLNRVRAPGIQTGLTTCETLLS